MSEQLAFYDRDNRPKWQFIALEVVKIFCDQEFLWWKNRIYEVQWSRKEIENSERVQLWSAILEAAISIGHKRNFDDDGKVRKSRWYFDIQDDSSEEQMSDEDEDSNPAPQSVY